MSLEDAVVAGATAVLDHRDRGEVRTADGEVDAQQADAQRLEPARAPRPARALADLAVRVP